MKEPKAHRPHDGDWGHCFKCDTEWPCKTWRKWLKSPKCRLKTLELQMADSAHMIGKLLDDVAALKRDAHRSKLIQGAQMEWLSALNQHTGHSDGIQIDQYTQELDVSSGFSSMKLRAPGSLIFRVRFGNGDWKS